MHYKNTHQKNASRIHKKVLDFFKRDYPEWEIIQEKPIEIDGHTLFCDFFSSRPFRFILEIQGRQHFEFVPHFHGTMAKFAEQQEHDQKKRTWAEMNGYKMIEIRESDFDESKLGERIMGAISA